MRLAIPFVVWALARPKTFLVFCAMLVVGVSCLFN